MYHKFLEKVSEILTPTDNSLEGIVCATRRYTFFYLALLVFLVNQFFWLANVLFTIDRNVYASSKWYLFGISILALVLTALLYAMDLKNIKKVITKPIEILLESIKKLDPKNPWELLEIQWLSCDDEFCSIVDTLNTKSQHIQTYIDHLKKVMWYIQHEYNTPLAILQLHTDQAKKIMPQNASLDGIQEEISHLYKLMNAMWNLINNEDTHVKVSDQNLQTVISNISNQVKKMHPAYDIRIQWDANITIAAHTEYLRSILRNLIENAFKHGSNNIDISYTADTISIRDHGPGITPEEEEYIWLPFWKKSRRKTTQAPGFGLWLALVKMLVHKQWRAITMKNHKDGGLLSTIHIS